MNRSDFSYAPLSASQYDSIVTAMEVFTDSAGNRIVSPLHGPANWQAAETQARAGDVDLRALLAALLFEDHGGTDPNGGVALAKVYNFGGIKWAGQPGAYDSGILCPPNEGGTYAGFRDFGGFVAELIRTLNNEYIGPAFTGGDLALAWAIYIGGPDNPNMVGGQARVDQWQYYRTHYPSGGTVADTGVYGEDIVAALIPHLGESDSDGTLDPWNGPHPWPGYCEAATEGAQYAAGLHDIVHRGSAALKLDAVTAQGLLQTSWPPEDGGICLWGRAFDPQGHTTVWSAAKQMWISTLYPPHAGLDYFYSDAWKAAMAGWYRAPGVVAANRAAPPVDPITPQTPFFVDGNPWGAIPVRDVFWSRWDEANCLGLKLDHSGAVNPMGIALPMFGYPVAAERTLPTGRRIQRFERVVMATQAASAPWNVVTLMPDEAAPYIK